MKKTILILAMACSTTLTASANPVSPEEALQKARGFLTQNQPMRIKGRYQ